jgi:hypothetical protein
VVDKRDEPNTCEAKASIKGRAVRQLSWQEGLCAHLQGLTGCQERRLK